MGGPEQFNEVNHSTQQPNESLDSTRLIISTRQHSTSQTHQLGSPAFPSFHPILRHRDFRISAISRIYHARCLARPVSILPVPTSLSPPTWSPVSSVPYFLFSRRLPLLTISSPLSHCLTVSPFFLHSSSLSHLPLLANLTNFFLTSSSHTLLYIQNLATFLLTSESPVSSTLPGSPVSSTWGRRSFRL